MKKFKDVHDAHCCRSHGCKYNDKNCTVVNGICEGIKCEDCEHEEQFNQKWIDKKKLLKKLQKMISDESEFDTNEFRLGVLKQIEAIIIEFKSQDE